MKRKSIAFILAMIMAVSGMFILPRDEVKAEGGKTLIVHYQRADNTYEGWNLWIWPENEEGNAYTFDDEDAYGKVAVIQLTEAERYGFIVRLNDWEAKDVEADRYIETQGDVTEIWLKSEDETILYESPEGYEPFQGEVSTSNDPVVYEEDSLKVKIHYHRFDNNYSGWNVWMWPKEGDGTAYAFDGKDEFGAVLTGNVTDIAGVSEVGFIVRLNEWEAKDLDADRFIPLSKIKDGILEVFLVQGDQKIYYDAKEVDLSPKFLDVQLNKLDSISIEVSIPFTVKDSASNFMLKAKDGTEIPIKTVISENPSSEMVTTATLLTEAPLDLSKSYVISNETYGEKAISFGEVFSSEAFNDAFYYDGNDLGATYSKDSTSFRLWAPTASNVNLKLYEDGLEGEAYDEVAMTKDVKGTWVTTVNKDLKGIYYTYVVEVEDQVNEAVDPYAVATGANGQRGMVLDFSTTNPEAWDTDKKPTLENITDAIIYELHIRDLSSHESSGIENKGKFLGLTEIGTKNPDGLATGLDHLKELGITHVHLLPSFDYRTVDETKLEKNNFNWGYDPQNYNVPEGSYSTDPYHGEVRVKEFKEMVQILHENDIRVVMDVVYNHTAATADSHLNKLVPNYYYRMTNGEFSNGSGCGNETASERKMVRKMMIDSVVYWAKEYHVDGFRFDLMGLHDLDTMIAIRKALDEIDPSIIVYGEGWTGGASPLEASRAALKSNTYQMPGIAAFSDDIRDGIKGHVFEAETPGFVNGNKGLEEVVKFGIVGATQHSGIKYADDQRPSSFSGYATKPWADSPVQSINYVSAHDNLTLWDKLLVTNPKASEEELIKMDQLANTIVLTSQGIPFLHAGVEMLRTKDGNHNSYNAPDKINQINWHWKTEHEAVYKYYQGLIAFRKAHPALRMTSTEEVQKHLTFFEIGKELPEANMVGYMINNHANDDPAEKIIVIFNANKDAKEVKIPEGTWQVCINGEKAGTKVIETITGPKVKVQGISALVLTSTMKEDTSIWKAVILMIIGVIAFIGLAGYLIIKNRKNK